MMDCYCELEEPDQHAEWCDWAPFIDAIADAIDRPLIDAGLILNDEMLEQVAAGAFNALAAAGWSLHRLEDIKRVLIYEFDGTGRFYEDPNGTYYLVPVEFGESTE